MSIFFKVCFTFLVLIAFPFSLFSQVYPYTNYSTRQGLINSNVYAMAQDHSGYIWFGTENGLSRFDGINFKNFTLEQLGLKSNIASLAITNNNHILFGSTGSSHIYIFNPINEKIEALTKNSLPRSNHLIIKNNLLISLHENRGYDFINILNGGIQLLDTVFQNNTSLKGLTMLKLKNDSILFGRSDGLYRFDNFKQTKVKMNGFADLPIYSIYENKNILLLGGDGIILSLSNNKVIDSIRVTNERNKYIRNIKVDKNNNIWFNVWGDKNIYMIVGRTIINISDKYRIECGTLTGILLEKSGNIYTSGLGKGIIHFNNIYLSNFKESENFNNPNIQKINKTKSGDFLLGTDNGLAFFKTAENEIYKINYISDVKHYVRDIISLPDNLFLIATIDHTYAKSFSNPLKLDFEKINIRFTHCTSFWSDSTNILSGNWDNKYLKYNKSDLSFINYSEGIFDSSHSTFRINCMFRDKFELLWVGSQKGLCVISKEGEKKFVNGPIKDEEVSNIFSLPDEKIFVVTNCGFYIFKNDPSKSQIIPISKTAIQGTNCIAVTGVNEYLVGTSYGLIFLKNNISSIMSIQDGVLSENINDIFYEPGSSIAWVATTEGLMQVDLEALRSGNKKMIEISEILLEQGSKKWLPETVNIFPYDSNSFRLQFQAFNYDNPHKIKYQYKLDDNEWLTTPANEIQFASMEHGNHTVVLRAGLDEIWGPEKSVHITVLAPFYKTWWFYGLIFCLSGLMLFLFIRYQQRVLHRKQEAKVLIQKKIVDLQQKALASNLNPHFVFNSLNAIQHFINSKNPAEANEYLAKFARLMRMHLNMAEMSTILLHDELHRLEYYLNLEQMRFDDKMQYAINLDPSLDPYHLEIPNMIIQPFVENAIWHGIMPSDSNGFISLDIKPGTNESIEVIITDNGVGFENQTKIIKAEHESKGTRLIRERLLLLDPSDSEFIRFEHLSPGTRVCITLTSKMYRKTTEEMPVFEF